MNELSTSSSKHAHGLPRAILVDPNDGCLTIARALVKRGVSVHAVAGPRSAYVGRSRAIEALVVADLSEGPAPWIAALEPFADDVGGVLISGSDAATEFLVRERERIPAALRSFEGPSSAHLRLMDKATLYDAAREAGVRCPWSREITTPEELDLAATEVPFPCIVKPSHSHRGKLAGNYRTALAADVGELRAKVGAAIEAGVRMLITEWVPGGEANLEGAVTLRTADGGYTLAYGRRKVRQHPIDFGVGSLLRSAPVPDTMELAKRLVEHTGFVGLSSFEAKLHQETGERVLTEINVRVPLNYGLGDASGVDASWRLYATLAGLPLAAQPAQTDGKSVLIPHLDAMAAASRLRRDELSLRGLVRSYRGTRDTGVLSVRDPGPGLALARRMLRSRVDRNRWERPLY